MPTPVEAVRQSQAPAQFRPFGWRDKIGYMFGDFGNDFTFIMAAIFLMVFYTNVLGISGAVVGLMFAAVRVVDAFTDIGMGRIIDSMRPAKDGRFRPWIRRMAIPVALASALMYLTVVKDWSSPAKIAWMFVTYFIWGSITYTGINIPYGSMASVVSNRPDHRSSLSVFRSLGATLAGVVISVVTPLVVYTKNADGKAVVVPENFFYVAVVYGILAVVCYALLYTNVVERVQTVQKSSAEKQSIGKLLSSLATNRALMGLVVAALLLLVSTMLASAMAAYLWLNYFNNGALQSPASLLALLPTFILVPLATPLGKRFGKKEIAVIGVAACGILNIVLYVMGTQNPWVFIAVITLANFGLGLFNMLIWAFITDVIDFQEVRTGARDDATVYAVYSWARKLGQALAGGLGGVALTWIGFQSGQPTQSSDTVHGIYMFSTLIPGALLVLVAVLLFFIYPLGKKQVEENVAFLAEKHAADILTA